MPTCVAPILLALICTGPIYLVQTCVEPNWLTLISVAQTWLTLIYMVPKWRTFSMMNTRSGPQGSRLLDADRERYLSNIAYHREIIAAHNKRMQFDT